jgi:outer membrane receptor protein involved in Fe transport
VGLFGSKLVDTTRSGRLIDQPNDILNLTLGYDIGGFSARLSFLFQDNVLRSADIKQEELDQYTGAYYRWDFTAYQKLPWLEGLQLYLNVNNIADRPDRQFRSVLEKLSDVQYYGRTADLGVRYSF